MEYNVNGTPSELARFTTNFLVSVVSELDSVLGRESKTSENFEEDLIGWLEGKKVENVGKFNNLFSFGDFKIGLIDLAYSNRNLTKDQGMYLLNDKWLMCCVYKDRSVFYRSPFRGIEPIDLVNCMVFGEVIQSDSLKYKFTFTSPIGDENDVSVFYGNSWEDVEEYVKDLGFNVRLGGSHSDNADERNLYFYKGTFSLDSIVTMKVTERTLLPTRAEAGLDCMVEFFNMLENGM